MVVQGPCSDACRRGAEHDYAFRHTAGGTVAAVTIVKKVCFTISKKGNRRVLVIVCETFYMMF